MDDFQRKERDAKAVEMYRQGNGPNHIARQLEISTALLYKLLRKAGVEPDFNKKRLISQRVSRNILFSAPEWEHVKKQALARGLSCSGYLRRLVLKEAEAANTDSSE